MIGAFLRFSLLALMFGCFTAPAALSESNDLKSLRSQVSELYRQGKYAQAIPIARRYVSLAREWHGSNHTNYAEAIGWLADLYRAQGRHTEAEPLYKRSLAIKEKTLGPNHQSVSNALNDLAILYLSLGRYREAELLLKRSIGIDEKTLGQDHANLAASLNTLAGVYDKQGQYQLAEPLYKRSIVIAERALGQDHPNVARGLSNFATMYRSQGRYGEAAPLYRRSLAILERKLGRDHPSVATTLKNLAGLYMRQGNYAEAEQFYKRSLGIWERALGQDHPNVAGNLNNLAGFYRAQGRYVEAVAYSRRGTAVLVDRTRRSRQNLGHALIGRTDSETARSSWAFLNFAKSAFRLGRQEPSQFGSLAAEIFQVAQWATGSEAAASLAKMAVRQAAGDPQLAILVRERQDLVDEWERRDVARNEAVAKPPSKRNKQDEGKNIARLAAIDKRIAQIDSRLTADFPDYAALANPDPLSIVEVQNQLKSNEALVLFLDTVEWPPTPEETFVWVLTKTEMRWVRSEFGTKALRKRVATLRCGLDREGEWRWNRAKRRWFGKKPECQALRPKGLMKREPLPFDIAKAHELYNSLLVEVEDLLVNADGSGKHLIMVPSGALTALPFQVLVSTLPNSIEAGPVLHEVARIGVEFRPLNTRQLEAAGLREGQGTFVVQAAPGGPAEAAGIQAHDIIVAIAEKKIDGDRDFAKVVQSETPGATVTVDLLRDGKPLSFSIVLGTANVTEWVPHYVNEDNARHVHWLVKRHALTVLPSVASLKALRRLDRKKDGKPGVADTRAPFIAFGDPVLTRKCNPPLIPKECPGKETEVATTETNATRSVGKMETAASFFRNGLADVAALKSRLCPLPDTAFEVACVAKSLGADANSLVLGKDMTESKVKSMTLDRYRVVHFATHGLLAGETAKLAKERAEPALVFSPPATADQGR